jgi:hypothetical protein
MQTRTTALVLFAAVVFASAASAPGQSGRESPARRAAKLYETASSQYSARAYNQAEPLLEKFVREYGTNENVTVASLQLAHCRKELKDEEGYKRALQQILNRFPGSPAWLIAQGALLKLAKADEDADEYFRLLDGLGGRSGVLPLDLLADVRMSGWLSKRRYYGGGLFDADLLRGRPVRDEPGWIMDVAAMATTPEYAERALKALKITLQKRAGGLPSDWQHVHVRLLRKADKLDEAQKAFDDYVAGWGDDPRVIELWKLEMKHGPMAKDEDAKEAVLLKLLKQFPGAGDLEEMLRGRLYGRRDAPYEEYTPLARLYLDTYHDGWLYGHVVDQWVSKAVALAGEGDPSKIEPTMAMLDAVAYQEHPDWKLKLLNRKIDLHRAAGRTDKAVELARKLVDRKYWSADTWERILSLAKADKAFVSVENAARKEFEIPRVNPVSPAFALLNRLKLRLQDDQVRHAEEIGEKLWSEHREDAATIRAVKLLADYYFEKVLPEPRDKWIARMVDVYHDHPLTESVLANQITAEGAARRYDRQARAIDKAIERFPSSEMARHSYRKRFRCFSAENDEEGALAFARKVYGPGAEAGDMHDLKELAEHELGRDSDYKERGDYWMDKAEKLEGLRQRARCLNEALEHYFIRPAYHSRGRDEPYVEQSLKVIKLLQEQELNAVIRWKLAFADAALLAHQGKVEEAEKALAERLGEAKVRDLSLRMDLPGLGAAYGEAAKAKSDAGKLKAGQELARRLRKQCPSYRDQGSIELMLASMYASADQDAQAARHLLALVHEHPRPARMSHYADRAFYHLRRGAPGQYPPELEKYLREVARVPELVPDKLYDLGRFLLGKRSSAVMQVHRRLVQQWPASSYRDKLEEEIAKRAGRGR